MRYVFVVTDDATLGSAGDRPPHLGEYSLGRLLVIPLPSVPIFFCAGFLCSACIFFILVSFTFIHLIKYQTTYISLQALFSLAYFDRSFLSSPKYPLKYLDRNLLSSNLAFRQISPRWNHFLDWCFSMLSVICSGTYNLVFFFCYPHCLKTIIIAQHCELSLKARVNIQGQIVFISQTYHSYTNEFLCKLTRMIDV